VVGPVRSLQAQSLLRARCALEFSGPASGLASDQGDDLAEAQQKKRSDTQSLDLFVKRARSRTA
jgi:hypothetical protein